MNPYRTYQQQAYSAWLRIDVVLALYDGAVAKLEAAHAALVRKDAGAAGPLLMRARLILAGLVSSVDPGQGELASQFLHLYEFVNYALGVGDAKHVAGAVKVLRTLREGLEAIRPEAAELERSGRIPPAAAPPGIQLTA
jgi:flagellin-specific chaperone FliS